jgi:hypothetical protein
VDAFEFGFDGFLAAVLVNHLLLQKGLGVPAVVTGNPSGKS